MVIKWYFFVERTLQTHDKVALSACIIDVPDKNDFAMSLLCWVDFNLPLVKVLKNNQ